jgi:hypothetical protein
MTTVEREHLHEIVERLAHATPVRSSLPPPLFDRPDEPEQALRDLMLIIEWLAQADLASDEHRRAAYTNQALQAWRELSDGSPALKAYARWRVQNNHPVGGRPGC